MGLCGFRHAEIRDAHNALLDIQLGGRSKELLGMIILFHLSLFPSLFSDHETAQSQKTLSFSSLFYKFLTAIFNKIVELYKLNC